MFRTVASFLLSAVCLLAQTNSADRSAPDPVVAPTPPSAATAMQPMADVNRYLPAWMRFDGQFRDRFEGLEHLASGNKSDNHDLTQLRIMLAITPADWLQFVGETQDSRIFWNSSVHAQPPYQNSWDVRQAYVQVGNASKGWFDFVAGREILAFGGERLVGPSDWLNMGRTFDVLRLNLHQSWFRLSLFASSVIIARDGVVDHHYEGNNLYGAYGSMTHVIPGATFEPFIFWRIAPPGLHLNENAGRGALNEATVGARVVGRAYAGTQYEVEMARQAGSLGPDSIDSWAGHWKLSRPLGSRIKPTPFVESNFATGTKNPAGTEWTTFDQLYPSAHNKLDFADQVGWRNIEQVRGGTSETAGRKWTFNETYEEFWLDSARDALYSSGGMPVAVSPTGAAGRHVGGELDLWAEWKWKETAEFGFGWGRFFTGRFLNRTTSGKDFIYPFIYLTYFFTQSKSPER